jgi:hypothetical protein
MTPPANAVEALRATLARAHSSPLDPKDQEVARIIAARDQVMTAYRPVFSPGAVAGLDKDVFRGFLLIKNNRHWSNLQRMGGAMTEDLGRLREALSLLVDEGVPLKTRLDKLRPPAGTPMVRGLSRSVITAILQVVYPDKYGVWNSTSEAGMAALGLWPAMPGSKPFSDRYEAMNAVLLDVADRLGADLWTLDALWWRVIQQGEQGDSASPASEATDLPEEAATEPPTTGAAGFGLERHLQEFLVDNWSWTDLGHEWDLLEEDGEVVGVEYNTVEVGRIDLLARHKVEDRWLVIELKRGASGDVTVGQLLRYMGWVRRNLAKGAGRVEGLIVAREVDQKLRYAVDGLPGVRCVTYRVSFVLEADEGL